MKAPVNRASDARRHGTVADEPGCRALPWRRPAVVAATHRIDDTNPQWQAERPVSRFGCVPLLLALLAGGALACGPRLVVADDTLDGLDVTMEVLSDESELDALVSVMRAPDDRGFRGGRLEDEELDSIENLDPGEDSDLTRIFANEPDGFEEDIADHLSELELEDAFESDEGDDLDVETYAD